MNCPEIIWVITGHGPFAQYLARMKVIKENKCNCDNATEQSAVHLQGDSLHLNYFEILYLGSG